MSYIYLFLAGLLEVAWAYFMKQSNGFSKLAPSVVTIALMVASFGFLAAALKHLPIGTAYATWTGIGAVGTALIGILILKEPATSAKFASISLIVIGIIGLHIFKDK